jgi:hypothetical protein
MTVWSMASSSSGHAEDPDLQRAKRRLEEQARRVGKLVDVVFTAEAAVRAQRIVREAGHAPRPAK